MPTRNRLRRPRISKFAQLLLTHWRKLGLPLTGEPIIIAVSGGADSTAMLLAIDELRRLEKLAVQPTVAHFDHRIRKTSSRDARWVSESAKRLGYPVTVGRAKVADVAKAESDNLEQVARRLRYEFLERTAKKHSAHFVLTAHTMDDQGETVLLRLMRGSADVGLSGMDGLRPLRRGSEITLARPLLWARREETVDYCHHSKAEYLTDEMNDDETFARVKVRKQLLPLMQSFNS